MVVAKKYVVAQYFQGEPKASDLLIIEEELPALNDGEFLVQAEYLSVDPYMRAYIYRFPLGITMFGLQVGKIIQSKNSAFPLGKYVVGAFGWRTYTVVDPSSSGILGQLPYLLPDFDGLSPSLGLGVLGRTGNTAYFGLLEICKPKAGETLVVSGAAGSVGSHVGQIGKILGLKVIGITGSDEKCKWLTDELGFDDAINYKTQNVSQRLKEAAPNKIDCYFDNVGGDISSIVLYQMNTFGRVAVCGSISSYNSEPNQLPTTNHIQRALINAQVKMEGFIVSRWADRRLEGTMQNLQWIKEGKLKYRETCTEGFEKMFDPFVGMLRGENTGKAIARV